MTPIDSALFFFQLNLTPRRFETISSASSTVSILSFRLTSDVELKFAAEHVPAILTLLVATSKVKFEDPEKIPDELLY